MNSSEWEEQELGKSTTRREFLSVLLGLFGLMWGAMAAYPLYRYLRAPADSLEQSHVTSLTVSSVKDLPVGTGKNFQFGSIPALLIHTSADEFHAFTAVCTHLGCTVQYRSDINRIWCACHGGQYDPVTGKNIAGPPPKPLTLLKAEVKNGNVIVSRA